MKNTLIKTIMIATLLFCSNLKAKADSCVAILKKAKKEQIVDSSNMIKNYQLSRMYAMQNSLNLKAYHISAKFFNPFHKVPTAEDLENGIKSHPYFVGRFNKKLSKEEYFNLKAKIGFPFFILETYKNDKSDFYMVHSKGVRHFTVNISNEKSEHMASLDNGSYKVYPSLSSFIACTIGRDLLEV